ncbi:hypothetical protein TURU_089446 [Turdus rufiventris]|nr:hypothetical protein TURU_089446 [Turdus rufiventris]
MNFSDHSASIHKKLRQPQDNMKKLTPEKSGVRTCKNDYADTKVSEEEGEGGAPGTRAEIPLQPILKTMVKQAITLQPMEDHGDAEIHPQPMEEPHATWEETDPVGDLWREGPCSQVGVACP